MMNKLLLSGLLFSISASALTQPVFIAADYATITANIAANDITRIIVKDDRIDRVHGLSEHFQQSLADGGSIIDRDHGTLFIQPNQEEPFTLHISTENQHHYTLRLTAIDMPAETLVLQSTTTQQQNKHLAAITSQWIALLKAMINQHVPSDYKHTQKKHAPVKKITRGLYQQLRHRYQGNALQGEVYRLTNRSHKRIQLTEEQFYQPGVLTISLEKFVLKAGEATQLYQVTQYDH